MINLTSQYPNTPFLPFSLSLLAAQVASVAATNIPRLNFPYKLRRANVGTAPDGSGALTSQIDVLIGNSPNYAFPNLAQAQQYAREAAPQMVNNGCFFVENIAPTIYQMVVWAPV